MWSCCDLNRNALLISLNSACVWVSKYLSFFLLFVFLTEHLTIPSRLHLGICTVFFSCINTIKVNDERLSAASDWFLTCCEVSHSLFSLRPTWHIDYSIVYTVNATADNSWIMYSWFLHSSTPLMSLLQKTKKYIN